MWIDEVKSVPAINLSSAIDAEINTYIPAVEH